MRTEKLSYGEQATENFMHFYNLYALFGQERIQEQIDALRKEGYIAYEINTIQQRAIERSNWRNSKYIAERFESEVRQSPSPMAYFRR